MTRAMAGRAGHMHAQAATTGRAAERPRRRWRRLAGDRRGVALSEGAIIIGFMAVVLVGMLEVVNYFTTAMKVTEAADGIANMVTSGDSIDDRTVTDLGGAIDLFLEPLEGSPRYLVAQIVFGADGTPSLAPGQGGWIERRNGMTAARGPLVALAQGQGLPGEALIVTRVEYDHTPILSGPFSLAMPSRIVETAFAKPRTGRPITYR